MKKLFMCTAIVLLGASTLMVAQEKQCCQKKENSSCCKKTEQCCKSDFQQKWAKFETLSVEEQKSLLETRKAKFKEMHSKMAADFKAKEKENQLTNEMKQQKKEAHSTFKNDWKKINEMSISEQKAFFDKMDQFFSKKCCTKK